MNTCKCASFLETDVDDFSMKSPVLRFNRLQDRGPPCWWLCLARCDACQTYWLLAQEERLNDLYLVHRLVNAEAQAILDDARWPETFSTYEELLKIGKAHGRAARYHNTDELIYIVIDLVGQRSGITSAELANLVNVTHADAERVLARARGELAQYGYPYPWGRLTA